MKPPAPCKLPTKITKDVKRPQIQISAESSNFTISDQCFAFVF